MDVPIRFATYSIPGTPLYVVVIGSLLGGLVIGWIMYILHAFSTSLSRRGKEKEIKEAKKTIADLTKRIHELELENAKLSGNPEDGVVDDRSL